MSASSLPRDDLSLLSRLERLDASTVSDADKSLRVMPAAIRLVSARSRLLGRAVTANARDDLLSVLGALRHSGPGDVLVVAAGGSRSFYRALERHGIRPHPCPDCHIARFSGYAPIDPAKSARSVAALPFPLSPIAGETLASFLGRLSAANHLQTGTLLEVLPAWFRVKIRWHDDR